ncbi:MAG TPA: ester cyclase [Chloroflexia bacterium]|nr:ester cyclase [Chloroflexia bacterium]
MNTNNQDRTGQNKQVVRRFFDVFNTHSQAGYDEIFSNDYVLDFPGGPGTARGIAGLLKASGEFLATFPDLHFTLDTVIAEGEYVAAFWTMQGHQEGPLGPIPGTGKPVTLTGTSLLRVVDGKIVEDRVRADLIGLMQQIGAMPAPEPVGL